MAAACAPALPEPESQGAAVYRARCGGCHRLFLPGTMTLAMWRVQTDRMRAEFARRGLPWLTADEERALMDWLGRHAEGAG